jgi:hypothetical protein
MRFWSFFRNLGAILDRLSRIEQGQSRLHRKVDLIMAKQDDLNNLVARIDVAVSGIRSDIEGLKADNPDVDFSALEARVAGLEGLDAEYPAVPPQEPENPGEPQQ